ncbi:tetrahydromethanopterin S-methyltransferase subunit A [bacterium BMS3Abin05]|nr:tetrahydromethanopterin S-methyltransferase subunit A [bacterium BMS3Abin05]
MAEKNPMDKIRSELREGMELAKCRKCGCMKETLESLRDSLSSLQTKSHLDLAEDIDKWLNQMEQIKYSCLGCEYCYPAVAMNIFTQAFPKAAQTLSLGCAFEVSEHAWPPVPGEYFAFCKGQDCPVAVSTLASAGLAERFTGATPEGLCIVGKTETENIGIDKIIKNTITNPAIRFLILAGKDPKGHHSGGTLLALGKNGVNDSMKVIGSPGKRPILRNVNRQEVETFRKQVRIVDMIGCEDAGDIVGKIKELSQESGPSCGCETCADETQSVRISTVPVVQAKEPKKIRMDRAGYFVILPQPEKGIITVEHYSYDNRLLKLIEGRDARSLYWTIIENRWVTRLSHAAYLGKELAKAELSIKLGFKYVQDGA